MSNRILGAIAATLVLGAAPLAHAANTTVDLSAFVNQGFDNGGWFETGYQFQADLPGTTFGNQGSATPFLVANVDDGKGTGGKLNYWYGRDDGTNSNNLFNGPVNSFTVAVDGADTRTVYTLAANTFGQFGHVEFEIIFHGANGNLRGEYIGGVNTRDYYIFSASTGCCVTPGGTPWYSTFIGNLDQQAWLLPENFGLSAITFRQGDNADGAIVAGLTLSDQVDAGATAAIPEPATWALMIAGFGMAGGALRRRAAARD